MRPNPGTIAAARLSLLPPIITSNGGGATASIDAAENQSAVTTVVAVQAHGGGPIVYTIAGGADAAAFTINASSGALTFVDAPDFETPTDANADNAYLVTVRATGRGGLSNTQSLTVTVTDVGEGDTDMPLISRAAISVPVEYVDIALPSGYDVFQLVLSGAQYSDNDNLAAALSANGGTTFLNDVSNADSYAIMGAACDPDALLNHGAATDGVISLTFNSVKPATIYPMSGTIWIWPGSASEYPTIATDINYLLNTGSKMRNDRSFATFNSLATVPPTSARQNMIRIFPYGSGHANPPTGGETINAGVFNLFGVLTP